MKISVLIATRNRSAPLLRCLESVANQCLKPHEVLVLDDASDELRVAELLQHAGVCDVRVLRSHESLGVARGRNRLFTEASGDVFFILDDDAYFDGSDGLGRLTDILRQRPRTGIVATRIVDHWMGKTRLLVPFPRSAQLRTPQLTEQSQLVSYFLGGGHAIRRELYEKIGGYDDSFVFGEEELELSYRTIQAGYEIFYTPDVAVQHHRNPSVFRSTNQPHLELFYHVRNRLLLAKKYLPAAYVGPYLGVWLSRYAAAATRDGTLAEFFGGLMSGLRMLGQHVRTPLSTEALSYLRRNHGRLWF